MINGKPEFPLFINKTLTFHLIDDERPELIIFPSDSYRLYCFYCKNEKFPFLIKFSKVKKSY